MIIASGGSRIFRGGDFGNPTTTGEGCCMMQEGVNKVSGANENAGVENAIQMQRWKKQEWKMQDWKIESRSHSQG